MKISIYGTGCAKCEKTTALVKQALQETGVQAEVEKVGDVREIVMAGVLSTPAVGIDGTLKVVGRIPTLDEIKGWITA